jgi:Concanavalin A-like lectin/glucanases superfamily
LTMYINGSQVAQNTTVTQSYISEILRIGAHYGGGTTGSYWNGKIAQARVYNTALSAANILTNFNATKGGYLVATSSLVAYYDPADTASYLGSGTRLNNLVGSDLSGTMTSVSYTSPYLSFNGSTSQVSIPDNASLEPGSGDWSIEIWIRYTAIAGQPRTYLSKTNNGGGAVDWGYGFRTNIGASTTYMEVGNGTTSVTSPSTSVSVGVWYQIVGVWTNVASNSIALYKNGVLVGSNVHSFASIKNTSNPLYIGNYNGNEYAQQFEGDVGIVRIYNKALSADEIKNNYDANKATYGLT